MFHFHFSPLFVVHHQPSASSHLCARLSSPLSSSTSILCVIVKVNILRYQGEFFLASVLRTGKIRREQKKVPRQFYSTEDGYGPTNQVPPHHLLSAEHFLARKAEKEEASSRILHTI